MSALLIVDDHPVYREALLQYLSKKFHALGVSVFSAPTVQEGIDLIERSSDAWTVLLDLSIPDVPDYLEGVYRFKSQSSVQDIIAISGLEEGVWGERCIEAGCRSFISKNNESIYIFEQLQEIISSDEDLGSFNKLTDRQQQILDHMAKGQPNKIIADLLNIKEQTVKIHINEIFKKLKVFNRTQAVLKAQEIGLL